MKKEKVLTRKGKALRRIGKFLVIVFICNYVFGLGLLLPRQAVWQHQEREGITGVMRTVKRDWVPQIHATHLRYLTQNEKAVMLAGTYFTIYGWMGAFATSLDCTTGEPLYAGMDTLAKDGRSVHYWFGRVDDPAIETVEISLGKENYTDGRRTYEEVVRFFIPKDDWMEQSGRQFFLLKAVDLAWPERTSIHAFAIGSDGAGQELYRTEITDGSSSYFGLG